MRACVRVRVRACFGSPTAVDELHVMAYNNENGFSLDGYFNGDCFVDVVRVCGPTGLHALTVVVFAIGNQQVNTHCSGGA